MALLVKSILSHLQSKLKMDISRMTLWNVPYFISVCSLACVILPFIDLRSQSNKGHLQMLRITLILYFLKHLKKLTLT